MCFGFPLSYLFFDSQAVFLEGHDGVGYFDIDWIHHRFYIERPLQSACQLLHGLCKYNLDQNK